jgi:hypothetical protein
VKNRTLIGACLCLMAGLAVSANAQAIMEAKVPFAFVVSGKTLPAGEYMLIANPHQIKIEDGNSRVVAYVLANDVSIPPTRKPGQVIFRCYGNRCFLAELWSPSLNIGREVIRSRAEAEFAKEQRGQLFAVLGETPKRK